MVEFYKYHALGNDYIVLDSKHIGVEVDTKFIKSICDRHTGIGGDGVLAGPYIDGNKISFRIFNSDGSEAERSGNGIRIFAKYLYDIGYMNSLEFDLYTTSGISSVTILNPDEGTIKACMGSYTKFCETYEVHQFFMFDEIVKVNYINIGNPHCVVFFDDIDAEKVKKIGLRILNQKNFFKNTNVQIVKVLDKNNLQIEILERGAGYTLSSGTGCTAASCIAKKLNFVSSRVVVKMPGGSLSIDFDDLGNVFLTGPVKAVSKGTYFPDK